MAEELKKPKAYEAWLVEFIDGSWWDGDLSTNDKNGFTRDPNKAIKFLFREDAEKVCEHLKDCSTSTKQTRPTSHQWGFMDEILSVELSDEESKMLSEAVKLRDMDRGATVRRALRLLFAFDQYAATGCKITITDKDGNIIIGGPPMGCGWKGMD